MEKAQHDKIVHNFLENPDWSLSKIGKTLKIAMSTVCDVIKRFKGTYTTNRTKTQTLKRGCRNRELGAKVIRSLRANPELSDGDRAKILKTSASTIRRIRLSEGIKAYVCVKNPNRSDKQN